VRKNRVGVLDEVNPGSTLGTANNAVLAESKTVDYRNDYPFIAIS
jgi:hypothetical protein